MQEVTIEEWKLLETTWVTLNYKATVVLRWYVSGPEVMVVSIVILFSNEDVLSPWFSLWDKNGSLRIFPLLLLRNAVLYFRLAFFEGFKVWINLLAESPFPTSKNSRHSFNWLVSADIFAANEKHMVLKLACDPSFGRSRWNSMACRERSIDVLKYIQFFQLSCNIQTLFYWGQKGELCTSYHIQLIS